jgi:acyl carrier protein
MNTISTAITKELAELVVATLNLEQSAESLDPDAPLFGDEGLGLDSIDVLEIALAISKRYGFQLRSDDENNKQIFASLKALTEHVALHAT